MRPSRTGHAVSKSSLRRRTASGLSAPLKSGGNPGPVPSSSFDIGPSALTTFRLLVGRAAGLLLLVLSPEVALKMKAACWEELVLVVIYERGGMKVGVSYPVIILFK